MEIILKDGMADEYFTVTTYPDGQRTIILNLDKLNVKESIDIKCRIKDFADLELLLCLVAALDRNDFHIGTINFIYMFGLRSDRIFCLGEPNYVKDVLFPILNIIGNYCENMEFYVPHNPKQIYRLEGGSCYIDFQGIKDFFEDKIIIFGDKSSSYWHDYFYCYFEDGYEEIESYYFTKVRNGKEINIELDDKVLGKLVFDPDKSIIIFDDICDGGGTFIAEAKFLKERFPGRKLELFVTHGIFSKGFEELFKYFDKIYTTNSYQNFPQNLDDPFCIPLDKLKVIKVI